MQPDNRINRLVSNHFDGDQIILMELFATDLSELNKMMEGTGLRLINGLDDVINTIRNGRPLGKKKERLISNMLRSFDSYPYSALGGLNSSLSDVMKRALEKMMQTFGSLEIDDPTKYHSEHMKFYDLERMVHFLNDQTAATRRILELKKLGRPELSLPALKDQYVLNFEKLYKAASDQMHDTIKDALDKRQMYQSIEEVLALNKTFGQKEKTKSDLRCMRNLFSHPDRIDFYDHYHLRFEDGTELDMYEEDLIGLTTLMGIKMMLMTGLIRVFFDMRVYDLILLKQAASTREIG